MVAASGIRELFAVSFDRALDPTLPRTKVGIAQRFPRGVAAAAAEQTFIFRHDYNPVASQLFIRRLKAIDPSTKRGDEQISAVVEVWKEFGRFCQWMNISPYAIEGFRSLCEKAWGFAPPNESRGVLGHRVTVEQNQSGIDQHPENGRLARGNNLAWHRYGTWRKRLAWMWLDSIRRGETQSDLSSRDGWDWSTDAIRRAPRITDQMIEECASRIVFGFRDEVEDRNVGGGTLDGGSLRDGDANQRRQIPDWARNPTVEVHRVWMQGNGDVRSGNAQIGSDYTRWLTDGNSRGTAIPTTPDGVAEVPPSDGGRFLVVTLDSRVPQGTPATTSTPAWDIAVINCWRDYLYCVVPMRWYYDLLTAEGGGPVVGLRSPWLEIDRSPASVVDVCARTPHYDFIRNVRKDVIQKNSMMAATFRVKLEEIVGSAEREFAEAYRSRIDSAAAIGNMIGEVGGAVAGVAGATAGGALGGPGGMAVGAALGEAIGGSIKAVSKIAASVFVSGPSPNVDIFGRLLPCLERGALWEALTRGEGTFEIWMQQQITRDQSNPELMYGGFLYRLHTDNADGTLTQILVDPTTFIIPALTGDSIGLAPTYSSAGTGVNRRLVLRNLPAYSRIMVGESDVTTIQAPFGDSAWLDRPGGTWAMGMPSTATEFKIIYPDGVQRTLGLPPFQAGQETVLDAAPSAMVSPSQAERDRLEALRESIEADADRRAREAEDAARRSSRNSWLVAGGVGVIAAGALWAARSRATRKQGQ